MSNINSGVLFCFVLFYITFGAEKHLSQQKSFTSGNKREKKTRGYVTTRGDNMG